MPILDLTISIVNYNTFSFLAECLDSIYANADGLPLEVIVTDNASRQAQTQLAKIKERFPLLQIIANNENRYFTGGHNQALAKSRGTYFLILNPDTTILPQTLATLFSFMEAHADVGAVTCKELNALGQPVITCTRFPTPLTSIVEWTWLRNWPLRRVIDNYLMADWQRDTPRQVDVGTGCFLFTRTALLRQFGGFDEGIRLYYSEYDLCMQLTHSGYKIYFLPDAAYLHAGQQSSSQESLQVIRKIHFQDMFFYFSKYHGHLQARLMMQTISAARLAERGARVLSPKRWIQYTKRKLA